MSVCHQVDHRNTNIIYANKSLSNSQIGNSICPFDHIKLYYIIYIGNNNRNNNLNNNNINLGFDLMCNFFSLLSLISINKLIKEFSFQVVSGILFVLNHHRIWNRSTRKSRKEGRQHIFGCTIELQSQHI